MNQQTIPEHIAIIMDGNGRWAKQRGIPRTAGHKEGGKALKKIIRACKELGVKQLSVYAFSTENWKRPEEEVSFLKGLLKNALLKEVKKLSKEGVRIRFLGQLDAFEPELVTQIRETEEYTKDNSEHQLNIMLNYGSRAEIVQAVNKAVANGEEITEEIFSELLYTKDIPDPELIIRTSGEQRLSNFLLWQAAYSEFYFTDTYWPDFDKKELEKAIADYSSRKRRFGGLDGS